jgi:hypothetical protein
MRPGLSFSNRSYVVSRVWDPQALGADGEGTHDVLEASWLGDQQEPAWSELTAKACGTSRGPYTAGGAATIG